LVKALAYANQEVASYNKGTINIYLLKGDHFMTRSLSSYVLQVNKKDQYSGNQEITIQPAFCSTTVGGHTFGGGDSDCIASDQQITIYYQMGNIFEFKVPLSLTIQSIIFDALDSSFTPTEGWLTTKSKCWNIADTTLTVNSDNPSPISSWTIQSRQTEECVSTFGGSLFQFQFSETLSTISSVGTLTISKWTFQNFFYDFTSLIGLTEGHGKVSIIDTTFNKFSNWASIIRDTREYPSTSKQDHPNIQENTLRGTIASVNILQDDFYIKPNTACTSTICKPSLLLNTIIKLLINLLFYCLGASITIQGWTFSNFNYMKSASTAMPRVGYTNKMHYQGLILNLVSFYGNIKLKSNTFTSLQFKFSNCNILDTAPSYNSSTLWTKTEAYQVKSLIYVNLLSNIELVSNTFTSCNSFSGIVYISKTTDTTAVLIHSNTFTKNTALAHANVIRIDILASASYET
jgi:hypothetical protein